MPADLQTTLLQLFEQVQRDPNTLPVLPPDEWPEDADQQHLLRSFHAMLERLQQHQQEQLDLLDRFSLPAQGANDGLWVWHLSNNAAFFSPHWKRLLGYQDHEIAETIGEWRLRLHPDDTDRVLEMSRAVIEGKTDAYEIEYRLRHKDGSYHWVLDRATTRRDASGQVSRLAGSMTDITERKLTEERLHERDEQYHSLFEAVSDGLFITDLEDRRLVEVNQRGCELYGYTREEFLGRRMGLSDDTQQPPVYAREVVRAGGRFQMREICSGKDGRTFPADVRALPFPYQGTPHMLVIIRDITVQEQVEAQVREREAQDHSSQDGETFSSQAPATLSTSHGRPDTLERAHEITEQAQAEVQLREREEQYRSIFEAVTDGILIVELDENRVVEVNPRACELTGFTRQEFLGRVFLLCDERQDPPLYARDVVKAGSHFQMRDRGGGRGKDGKTFPSDVRGSPFMYKGKPHMLVIVRDIAEQVQAEEQLREREAQYRSIFEATKDAVLILDLEDGHVVEANPAACQLYGYAYSELIGLNPSTLIHPDSLPLVAEAFQTVRKGGQLDTPGMGKRKDGTSFPVEGHLSSFLYKGKPHALAVIRDITERVQAEQQLREREEQYRSIFEATSDGLAISDLDGLYVEANPAFCRMLDYSYEELIGQHYTKFTYPEFYALLAESRKRVQAGGQLQAQGQIRRKDGSPVHVDAHYTSFTYKGTRHVLVVLRDITEQVEAEQQLREREEQYRSIFEAVTDGILIVDLDDGRLVEMNPAACKISGYTREEALGQPIRISDDTQDPPVDARETVRAGGFFQGKGPATGKDGKSYYMEAHVSPFTYKGKPHMLEIVRDITEQMHAEQQLREREEQYRSIFESTTDAIFIMDLEDGHIIEANPAACTIYGYSYEEFIGLPPGAFIRPDQLPLFLEEGLPVLRLGGKRHIQGEGVNLRKDGSTFPIDLHQTTFTYQGKPRILSVIRDITEQVEAERELREREALYRGIFEATYDGLCILDMDGHFVEVNPAYCQMFGYTHDELIGMDGSTLVAPVSHPVFTEALENYKAGRGDQGTALGLRKDGTAFPAEAHGGPITYRGKPHALGVVRDITERLEAERELREREALYRGIFETTYDGLMIFDLDGYVVEVNPASCQLWGYPYEELIGMHGSALVAHASQAAFNEAMKLNRAGRVYQAVGRGLRKDGSVFPFDTQTSPITYRGKPHALAAARDITEQVEARRLLEQRVQERTRELATLLEVSHNVASTLELKPLLGLILDQLKSVVEYSGASINTLEEESLVIVEYRGFRPAEQMVGRRFSLKHAGLLWETMLRPEPAIINDVLAETPLAQTYRGLVGGDLLNTSVDQIGAWMAVPLTLKEQVMGMLTFTAREPGYFTTRHAALAQAIANQAAVAIANARLYEQAQALAALEERQKLARELHDSVSQALYGIALGAHSARTALQRDPEHVSEPLDYVLSLAEAGLAEMRALIFELRPESLETEGLVSALTKQGTALQARHELSVHLDLCDEPPLPLAVKQELYRIAQEAMHNTVKHARAHNVDLCLSQTQEAVLLEVGDDGLGFDPQGSFPGHLGLRSMRERVSQLGGTLRIESAPGEGTRLYAQVPMQLPA